MGDFQTIQDIIKKEIEQKTTLFCAKSKKRGLPDSYYIELKEGRYKVKIVNMPQKSIAIKADLFKTHESVIAYNKYDGIHQCADYILISVDKKLILFIELKSPSDKDISDAKKEVSIPIYDGIKEKIKNQLRGAECLMYYCTKIGKNFCDPNFLSDYEFRYIAIVADTEKIATHPSIPTNDGTSPENFLFIPNKSEMIPFNKLTMTQRLTTP